MSLALIYSILSVLAVSLISFVGLFTLSIKEDVLKEYVFILVSLAVGALLGDAFLHLIPESFEKIQNGILVVLAIAGGMLVFFILEKFLHWHHHLEENDEKHHHLHHVGKMILISDGLHNFIDGLIIGASYIISVPVGVATTIAVILHEIPQEIGDFGVLLHSGYSRRRALWFNFLSALTATVGVVVAFLLKDVAEIIALWALPVAAGGFIYIAMSDLVPELFKTKNKKHIAIQLAFVLLGFLSMLALLLLES